MKRIIFVRHAKTETWEHGKDDFSRKLVDRGINDCAIMSNDLKEKNLIPQHVYSSSAFRAMQTSNLISEHLNVSEDSISSSKDLYEYVSVQQILNLTHLTTDKYHTIMIVGHNPWISNVASILSKNFHSILPTAGIVVLEFKVDQWQEVSPNKGEIIYYQTPKTFK